MATTKRKEDVAFRAIRELDEENFATVLKRHLDDHAYVFDWPRSERETSLAKLQVYLDSLDDRKSGRK
jgi:hypothetical protein